mmetsp:Transcript_56035/g.122789  ORF Transcript_56035/g.122789 Transcript_56035/m.122789 type:complete len:255 (-) Transcript_56035:9-773(-)
MQEIIIHEQDEPEHSLRHDVRQPVQQHKGAPMVGAAVVQHVTVLKNEIQRVRAPDQDGQPQQSLHYALLVLTGVGIVGMLQHAFADDVQSQQKEPHRHTKALPRVAVCRVASHVPHSNHEHISHQKRKRVPHIHAGDQSQIKEKQRSGDQPIRIPQPPEVFLTPGSDHVNTETLGHEEVKEGSDDSNRGGHQTVPTTGGCSLALKIFICRRVAEQEHHRTDHKDGEHYPTDCPLACRRRNHGCNSTSLESPQLP